MAKSQIATLGFSVHTGWSSMVAVAGPPKSPAALASHRLALLDGENADERRFVYHRASEIDLPSARRLVERTTKEVHKVTLTSLRAALAGLANSGYRACRAAIVASGGKSLPKLEDTLRAHAAIHAAEGQLYRHAIDAACQSLGVEPWYVPARELGAIAAARIGMAKPALDEHLAAARAALGPPWGQDQKQAMLAAWTALAEVARK
jgi:hypothetical protein